MFSSNAEKVASIVVGAGNGNLLEKGFAVGRIVFLVFVMSFGQIGDDVQKLRGRRHSIVVIGLTCREGSTESREEGKKERKLEG